jgi:glucose-1-phosphate thymidylyltransferase
MQAVILAAGEGRRVRPLTRSRPKAMIPVANRPIIAYPIEALLKCGIRDICVVVGYRKEQVLRYLNSLDASFEVVVQEKQIGTANALHCAEQFIQGDFLVLPGDNYIDPVSIGKIKSERNAMLVGKHPHPSEFGVVTVKGGFVEQIMEKPRQAPSFLVNTGVYAFTEGIFGILDTNRITDTLSSMIAEGDKIRAVCAENWIDALYPWHLLKMNKSLLSGVIPRKGGIISSSAEIQGNVDIGRGTRIGPFSVITGPAVIGENCTIGPHVCIMPHVSIGSRVTIEPFTCIGNSIVMDDSVIGSHSRVYDAVIGEGCHLLDNTSTVSSQSIIEIEDKIVRTTAFGVVMGDEVRSGPYTTLEGCIVGNNVTIGPRNRIHAMMAFHDDTLVI